MKSTIKFLGVVVIAASAAIAPIAQAQQSSGTVNMVEKIKSMLNGWGERMSSMRMTGNADVDSVATMSKQRKGACGEVMGAVKPCAATR